MAGDPNNRGGEVDDAKSKKKISTLLRVDRCHADRFKISEDYYGCKLV